MSKDTIPVTIEIMDKEFRIACIEGEQESLFTSARYVDRKMREIKASGKVIGIDKVAMMAALNIAHELLQQQQVQNQGANVLGQRIRGLQRKIESVLVVE